VAALVQALYFAGSRLPTGAPNDSGLVYAYRVGTTNPATLYADADATVAITQPITLDAGGRIPYSTYPDGVWITSPVRLLVQDVDGNTVSDAAFWPADARDTALDNTGFTDDSVDGALSRLYDSTGGRNATYKESGGATERPVQDKFREIWVSVKDFGAVGNGIAIDTVAIQRAVNRAAVLDATVYFPAGTYLIDQAITVTSADALIVKGAGMSLTVIASNNATANAFTVSSSDNIRFEDLDIIHVSTSSGSAIVLNSSNTPTFIRVGVGFTTTSEQYANGISCTASGTPVFWDCIVYATAEACILSSCIDAKLFGGLLAGGTYAIEFSGTTYAQVFGVRMADTGIVRFASGLTGTEFGFYGCAVTSYSVGGSSIPAIRQSGGIPTRSTYSAAVGNTLTPSLLLGNEIFLSATSGGAGTITVASPAVLPAASFATNGTYYDFIFKNASGGAVTWSLNAVFVVASAIPTTDAHTISVRFRWDPSTSKLREVARADTAT